MRRNGQGLRAADPPAEDRHWWYRGRRTVIEEVLDGLDLPAPARILDAGCGSGRNMIELARHGAVTGVELSHDERRARARPRLRRGHRRLGARDAVRRRQLRPRRQPRRDRASRGRPRRAARAAPHRRARRRAARDGPRLPMAVERARRDQPPPPPLHAHARCSAVAEQAGWRQVRTTYFNSLLLPVAILLRVLDRVNTQDHGVEPRPVGPARTAQLAARAPARARGGADRAAAGASRPASRCWPSSADRAAAALHAPACSGPCGGSAPRVAVGHRARHVVVVHAERPGAVGEERGDGDDAVASAWATSLSRCASWTNRYSSPIVDREPGSSGRSPSAPA